ncbi:adenomatous polyposis coli protein isoform X2 [Megalops cyprinoides]|uniref:adenomatous polyposis coli protein isoform X2 n=1 Tax=Megalops cyprinoides TaxID=118141 RepID=UPI00186531B1|nr:adenomatous polyposis coli protein isoform X2 [Megalops cyprinoides]
MAAASYDQLLKQVEALKMENSNLRQELEDNSNHLTKLETEASNMKEVLKQLQGSIEEESMESSGQIDLLERLKEMSLDPSNFPGVKLRPKVPMRSYDSREGSVSGRSGDSSPVPTGSFTRRGVVNGSRESAGYLEELEKERSLLMAELEKEEKEKDWYYAQLQNLTKRIDSLPLTENFSLQTDMTRRQLEYEARQIRAAMEEQLGTCQDMEKRAQARVARIQQIEKDMLRIRQHLQSQPADSETSQSKNEAASLDCERPSEGGQASGDTGMATPVCGQGSSARVDHEVSSDMSCGSSYSVPRRLTSHLGTKVEMVYSLLSMLGTHDKDDMSRTLLAMSSSQDSCIAMRQSGCLPLLIQLLHGNDKDSVLLGNSRGSKEARARASAALHNIIHSQPDDKRGRREIRVLHLLEQIRAYCETCWEWQETHERGVDQDKNPMPSPVEHQICPAVCVLMKLSFDEEHRHAMNELGGLQAIGELLQVDCEIYGLTSDHYSVTLRRYAGMALTNLTFGDVANKSTLCSMKGCMRAMVAQLKSDSEDLQQVIASVLRNLSWRADVNSKKTLREVGSVKALMECALDVKKESTLKSVLSALWNLSAHCTENKADICAVDGALAFLVGTLTYRSQTNTLAIIESGGGILRNVSSLIATNEDHRQILRENNCLQTLLQHLKSHSLTIVSNACGTLWNLSARNAKDQETLWDMGAVSMLKNLIHSKHKMIAMGSAAALRNLMANRPAKYKDANIMSPGSSLPSLHVRKQKALIEELDAQHLSETFDNIDNLSPKASHRSKPRHKQTLYNEYVLDSRRNDDSVCRAEGFNSSNITVLSPYMNTPVLSSSSRESRGNSESSRTEKDRSLDRERRGGVPGSFHPSDDSSKRIGMQISAAAQIAKVMEEVQSMHIGQDDRSAGNTQDMHCVQDEVSGIRRTPAIHGHSNVYSFNKPEHSSRNCPMPKMEYRASNDSLNSVSSSDGYGKRGQMKPSVDSYSEDEGKCCIYRKYPADLAHKIHSANHMEDDDGDLDTPINYSLKYSDEQLNSGRQSPSQNERWARPKHLEDDIKRPDQKAARSQSPGYPRYTENSDSEEKHKKYQSRFVQPEHSGGFRSRSSNSSEQSRGSSTHGTNKKTSQTMCSVDDYGDDKPTNYSERYSEEQQHDEDQPTNYSMKYNEEHHVEQPIDYSLKYSDTASQKAMFSHAQSSTSQNSAKDHLTQDGATASVTSLKTSNRQKQLHPSSSQARSGPTRVLQKSSTCKAPSINQETLQTYCVEDTPICFSRGSSLSSLSSEDEIEGHDQAINTASNYPTLPIADKEPTGTLGADQRTAESQTTSQYIRMKPQRNHGSISDGSRHKAVEFSSGAKSPSKSGAQTPKSPPEHYVQETPLMFSRCTSVSSLDSFESHSIASSVQSEPCSGMVSGIISPSDLPDSPGQTMPPSRSKTPPPHPAQMKHKMKVPPHAEKRDLAPRHAAVNSAVQKVQVLPDNDTLLHFATESTPDGFSCASSLSALSLDEPFIPKDVELQIMPPVHEDDHGNEGEPEKDDTKEIKSQEVPKVSCEPEKDILDDSDDDDIEILEACINSAMPTKSSRKPKKQSPSATSRIPPPAARKPSQLPVYKLLPSQNRGQQQKHVSFTHGEDMPRIYCVEGTPINFSTATSLSDLTIDSPPNELANVESSAPGAESSIQRREERGALPERKSTEGKDVSKSLTDRTSVGDDKNEGDDILAECISSAMPKGKTHKPFRVKKIIDQAQHPTTSPGSLVQQEMEKKKPTSPVKPMPQSSEYRARMIKRPEPSSGFAPGASYPDKHKDTKKQEQKIASRDVADKPSNMDERVRPGFAFDSPHHYTPIEGTPYCFSRNDSLSSLDFEDDDLDFSKEKAELRKEKEQRKSSTNSASQQPISHVPANNTRMFQMAPQKPLQKQATFPQTSKESTGPVPDEKQNFSIEDTPVCFSRNSSLSSLSDIDQENNNKDTHQKGNASQAEESRPQASGYAPKAFHVEDTPVCFSRNSSLSSLSIDSEDDLLQECISSAMPKKKKQPLRNKRDDHGMSDGKGMGGILAEEPDLILDLTDAHSPISEQALSPDSESFDWKAIQEGANSIVSSLHQAAASLSRQASSDSDSILSLKSGISIGSPFHLTPDQEEKAPASNKGPRILKPGEKSTLESKKKEEEAKSLKGGKKVYKSLITGKPRTNLENVSSQQRQTSAPAISRGRTMIHIPGVRSSSPSTSPVQKKTPPRGAASKISSQGQNSSNSPRSMKAPVKSDPSPSSRQPSSQGGSSKASSRSGSRDSTPSRPTQQPLTRPMQSPGRTSISPGRSGISPSNKLSQIPRTSSPSTPSSKSSGSGRMAYTSPGRHLGQQTPPKQSGLPRSTSGIPRSESASKGMNLPGATGSSKKAELSRMSSTKSSGSESDRSEKPVLVRQSTFIKEAPSPTLKRKLEESASLESLSPSSRPASPSRSQSQTPVSSPSLPDMSLTLPCQGSCWRKSPHGQNSSENGDGRSLRRHEIARSHSESPSRLPVNRSGTWKREHSKHSSSLPRVSTWKRTGSSSSILSASSESSEKARSEDERQTLSPTQRTAQSKDGHPPLKGTWRKMKENEISHLMTNELQDSSSDVDSKSVLHQMVPAVSKTEDVWVRIEDCPINNPRSGKSPTGKTPPVIDSVSDKVPISDPDPNEKQQKQPTVNENAAVRTLVSENNLNLLRSEATEKKGADVKPTSSNLSATETHEIPVAERTPFSSSNSSKHSSPSGAVAARVTPFNYNPSPRKSSADGTTARPSQIPTPVTSSTKKRDSKGENAEPSGSYIVTSV